MVPSSHSLVIRDSRFIQDMLIILLHLDTIRYHPLPSL